MNFREEIVKINDCVKFDEPMSKHTTFRIGGPADVYIQINSRDELRTVCSLCDEHNVPVLILGAGSNLLVSDAGIEGVVVKLSGEFKRISYDKTKIYTGAAVYLQLLVHQLIEQSLTGFEFIAGIPGTVGGAVIMNAGVKDRSISDVVETIEYQTPEGESKTVKSEEAGFGYRKSGFPRGAIITTAVFKLKKGKKEDIETKVHEIISSRMDKQPWQAHNAGSIFKNPENDYAGRIIEKLGYKGKCFGGAGVSEKHANFIVNKGNASAMDVRKLIREIQTKAKDELGILLELEIKIVGRDIEVEN
ncbi:MAG: UDP-N-acetylmuramate dehydrogenase [Elusimicrobiota bacterium]